MQVFYFGTILGEQPGFVNLVVVKCFVFSVEEVNVGIPAMIICKTDIVVFVVDGLYRCWSPQVGMDFIPHC